MANSTKLPHLKLPLITKIKHFIVTFARFFYLRRDGTINRRILSLVDMKVSAPATKRINSTTTVSTSDITIDSSRNLWFRLFVPTNSSEDKQILLPLIVYFHGGGFATYGPDTKWYDEICRNLAASTPAVIASVNYRLAPEHRYPTQYEDAFDALKFIDQQKYAVLPANTDMNNCFIAGDSAGGNIAHHVTFKYCQKSNEFFFEKIKIAGVLGFQPFFGGEERTESEVMLDSWYLLDLKQIDWMWRAFLPVGADRNHPAAHVFGGGEELMKRVEFPRCLIIVGGNDPLKDWQKKYVEWLKDCGKQVEVIEYPNAIHAFYAFPETPEHDFLLNDAANFIREQARRL